jgi:hypothetical protein
MEICNFISQESPWTFDEISSVIIKTIKNVIEIASWNYPGILSIREWFWEGTLMKQLFDRKLIEYTRLLIIIFLDISFSPVTTRTESI